MLAEMKPFDYVVPLLQKYQENGIRIAVLTDMTAHIQYRKLERLGLTNYVDFIVTSEEAGGEKPERVMFELILDKLQLAAEDVLMVGDSQTKDIDGALCCGMQAILYEDEKEFVEKQKQLIVLSEERRKGNAYSGNKHEIDNRGALL